jgi:Fis family transcriptional regulator
MKNSRTVIKKERRNKSLRSSVEVCLQLYLSKLDGDQPSELYRMVVSETEHALLETVMEYSEGNQSKAAEYLGITRGTLRKKLKELKLNNKS